MIRFALHWLLLAGMSLGVAPHVRGTPPSWPPTDALRAWLTEQQPDLDLPPEGDTEPLAYLEALAPEVLVGRAPEIAGPTLARTVVYPPGVGYLRVARVGATLPDELDAALAGLVRSNANAGLILDLRFAEGTDFAAAAAAAGRLASRPDRFLTIGDRTIPIPRLAAGEPSAVMVLANRRTSGAAEVLAAAVRRSAAVSLVLGTPTAGRGRVYREAEVPEGGWIRLAGPPVSVAGSDPLFPTGWIPDLEVRIAEGDERLYLENEYRRVLHGQRLPAEPSIRLNEAELVRRRRGLRTAATFSDPDLPPPVQDPVLARALDLLAGLSRTEPLSPASGDSR